MSDPQLFLLSLLGLLLSVGYYIQVNIKFTASARTNSALLEFHKEPSGQIHLVGLLSFMLFFRRIQEVKKLDKLPDVLQWLFSAVCSTPSSVEPSGRPGQDPLQNMELNWLASFCVHLVCFLPTRCRCLVWGRQPVTYPGFGELDLTSALNGSSK